MAQTAAIAASASGNNTVVTGVAGRRIRVLGFALSFSGSVNAKWNDGTSDMTGLYYGAANVQVASPPLPNINPTICGHFVCAAGGNLILNLSGATAVGGHVVYDFVN